MNTPGGNRYGWGVGRVPMPRSARHFAQDNGVAHPGIFASLTKIAFHDLPWGKSLGILLICISIIMLAALSAGKFHESDPPGKIGVAAIILREMEKPDPKPPQKEVRQVKKQKNKAVPKRVDKPKVRVTKSDPVVTKKKNRPDDAPAHRPVIAARNYEMKDTAVPGPKTKPANIPLPKRPEPETKLADAGQKYYAFNLSNRGPNPPGIATDSGPIRFDSVSAHDVAGPALFNGRYSKGGKKSGIAAPVAETGKPLFSGASEDAADDPCFNAEPRNYSSNRTGRESHMTSVSEPGGSPVAGISKGELSGRVSLDDLDVCIDPEKEFKLRSELAARLAGPGHCRYSNLAFAFKYVETGYTIHLDIHNPKNLRLGNRCDVLRKAMECIENR